MGTRSLMLGVSTTKKPSKTPDRNHAISRKRVTYHQTVTVLRLLGAATTTHQRAQAVFRYRDLGLGGRDISWTIGVASHANRSRLVGSG